jgi:hypothetical protein
MAASESALSRTTGLDMRSSRTLVRQQADAGNRNVQPWLPLRQQHCLASPDLDSITMLLIPSLTFCRLHVSSVMHHA